MRSRPDKRPRAPLEPQALERLALFYVGRYATTQARLRSYLQRKLKERGWEGDGEPGVDALVERMAARNYVDDSAFAAARSASLQRRGFGERRVADALRAAGIGSAIVETAREDARDEAMATALRFARRKRLGPFATKPIDQDGQRKAFAAMLRAGHAPDVVRRVLDASQADVPDLEAI